MQLNEILCYKKGLDDFNLSLSLSQTLKHDNNASHTQGEVNLMET